MCSILPVALLAFNIICAPPLHAADRDGGIVVLHGQWDQQSKAVIGLAWKLEAPGFLVATPMMAWSGGREYDVPYPQALNEIGSAVQQLRNKGPGNLFSDLNQGTSMQVRVSAESYFSYFDPEGLAAMPKTAAAIPAAIPVFMAVGSTDPMFAVAEKTIFARAPKHSKSAFNAVTADHIRLVTVIAPALIAWLKTLEY